VRWEVFFGSVPVARKLEVGEVENLQGFRRHRALDWRHKMAGANLLAGYAIVPASALTALSLACHLRRSGSQANMRNRRDRIYDEHRGQPNQILTAPAAEPIVVGCEVCHISHSKHWQASSLRIPILVSD
jgi:hypothetical protein